MIAFENFPYLLEMHIKIFIRWYMSEICIKILKKQIFGALDEIKEQNIDH